MNFLNNAHPRSLLAALTLAVPVAVAAHDLVLVPDPSGDLTVKFGHPNDWQPADKERLLGLRTEGDRGAPIAAANLVVKGKNLQMRHVATPGKAALVSARYDNGLWVTLPGAAGAKPNYFNTSKAMLPEGGSSMAAVKFAKALYGAAGDATVYKQPVGQLIELVPQSNPADAKAGARMKVLVLLNGQPLADAGVEVTDSATTSGEGQPTFKTDAAGIAEVPIRRAGLNVLSVDYETPNDGKVAPAMKQLPVDKIAMIATYAFQVR